MLCYNEMINYLSRNMLIEKDISNRGIRLTMSVVAWTIILLVAVVHSLSISWGNHMCIKTHCVKMCIVECFNRNFRIIFCVLKHMKMSNYFSRKLLIIYIDLFILLLYYRLRNCGKKMQTYFKINFLIFAFNKCYVIIF